MNRYVVIVSVLGVSVFVLSFFVLPGEVSYSRNSGAVASSSVSTTTADVPPPVSHISTPNQVKAIYMTSWVAGTPKLRQRLVDIMDTTEINSVVIDVKDYSGKISFRVHSDLIKKYGSEEIRIADLREFLQTLHAKGIYTIARIAVFQDAHMVKIKPEWAVQDDKGGVWKDRKGISWIDPGARDYWDYIVVVAKEAHDAGFDEINIDYIRYPSDGDLKHISYPWSQQDPKTEVLRQFFIHLRDKLSPEGIVISADVFGLTTTANDDLGIGQVFGNILPYVDYIAPMVYPSHYASGSFGFTNPAEHPYEVIKKSIDGAVKRAVLASSTATKVRPWLQDFDLGANYGAKEVREQIQATYDTGANSWMLWAPSNVYTKDALFAQ